MLGRNKQTNKQTFNDSQAWYDQAKVSQNLIKMKSSFGSICWSMVKQFQLFVYHTR